MIEGSSTCPNFMSEAFVMIKTITNIKQKPVKKYSLIQDRNVFGFHRSLYSNPVALLSFLK